MLPSRRAQSHLVLPSRLVLRRRGRQSHLVLPQTQNRLEQHRLEQHRLEQGLSQTRLHQERVKRVGEEEEEIRTQ